MSIRYYQKNKERNHKKACERYQNLLKKIKTKSKNMVVNDIEIFS